MPRIPWQLFSLQVLTARRQPRQALLEVEAMGLEVELTTMLLEN
jgi:hypothetical protein